MTETHLLGFVLQYESPVIDMPKQVELNMGELFTFNWPHTIPHE